VDDGLWRLHARMADGKAVAPANFRRDVKATGLLADTGGAYRTGQDDPARCTAWSPERTAGHRLAPERTGAISTARGNFPQRDGFP